MPHNGTTQTRTFDYNLSTNQLTSATNPENGTVGYSYYASGRLLSKTDGNSWGQAFTYDGFGNLTGKAAAGLTPYMSLSADPTTNHITTFAGQLIQSNNTPVLTDEQAFRYLSPSGLIRNRRRTNRHGRTEHSPAMGRQAARAEHKRGHRIDLAAGKCS